MTVISELVSSSFRVYGQKVPRVFYPASVRERALAMLRENPSPSCEDVAKALCDEETGKGPCVKTIHRWRRAAKIPRARKLDKDALAAALEDRKKTNRIIAEEFGCSERYVRTLRAAHRENRRAKLASGRSSHA